MSNTEDLQSLWQSTPTTPISVSVDDMRARSARFAQKVRRRNMAEYIACIVGAGIFTWYATWPEPATPLWPVANMMIVAGLFVIAWNLHRLTRAMTPPESASAESLIDFQRTEYVRQRDALKSVWLWYIGPVMPGLILWFIAAGDGTKTPDMLTRFVGLGGAAVISLLVFGAIIGINLLGASRLQNLIDELDKFGDQP
jgi:hypothetical protein